MENYISGAHEMRFISHSWLNYQNQYPQIYFCRKGERCSNMNYQYGDTIKFQGNQINLKKSITNLATYSSTKY